jgi:hypothetical protein
METLLQMNAQLNKNHVILFASEIMNFHSYTPASYSNEVLKTLASRMCQIVFCGATIIACDPRDAGNPLPANAASVTGWK